ncbi:MAG: ABC-type multidrug transport system, ATPase and permease component [Planctomycetaceae bacterium]|nr:ABC-type multidrug transport system, ATPase and permease component [Planctomycetaceae bacterium]
MGRTLPTEIANLMGTSQLQGRALLLAVCTDIDEGGHATNQWLIVTECELSVAAPSDPLKQQNARCLRTFPLAKIEGYRTKVEVGSGYLQIRQGQVWIDVLRFSNRLSHQFRDAVHKLEELRRYGAFSVEAAAEGGTESGASGADEKKDSADGGKPSVPSWQTLRRVFGLLQPYGRRAILIGCLSIVAVVIELAPPWLQMVMVDRVLGGKGTTSQSSVQVGSVLFTLAGIVSCLALIRLVAAVLSVWKAKLSSDIGTRLTADLRTQMVDKLQRLSVSYHDRNQVGMLMSRVSYDTEAMHTFMYQISGGFVLQVLQLLAIGVMLFVLNAKLAFYTLLPMPLVLVASWFFCRTLYVRHSRYWDAVGHQASALTSLLSGIRVVKSFTQEPREQAKFSSNSERLRESRLSVDLANATFSSLIGFLFGLGGLIVWYVGGSDVLADKMTLGSLMAFLAYLSMFYAPLTSVSEGASWISSFLTASHRIFDLLDTPVSVSEPTAPQTIDKVEGHIRFNQVNFSYDDQRPALEDVSFEVRKGESVGIVGRSGSGKSTLVCLISRLYDVDSGSITIDGVDVRQINTANLRRHVGMVQQEPFLFEGTVASNIAYGDPDASPERILASAKAASVHDFVLRMPFSYESILGEGGAGLSGGERQRVSIARAILYDPQILILDEATASIDTESERLIQASVERFSKGRTMLAIAHRLSTLESVDRLLVMDQGRLIEQGTHHELLSANGVYARLTRMQFGANHVQGAVMVATEPENAAADDAEQPAEDHDFQSDPGDVDGAGTSSGEGLEWEIRWLDGQNIKLFVGPNDVLTLNLDGQEFLGIYTVRAFPATHSENYLSLRYADPSGKDHELGMIRRLSDWPTEYQELIRRALNRRYLLRTVKSLVSLRDDNGFVQCSAETEDGRVEFTVHNNPHCVKTFGYNGRLLTDTDQNHYLIHDVDELPFMQKRLFRQYFHEM